MPTRVEIAVSVRNRTDQNLSQFITDPELYSWINSAIRELHRVLVDCSEENFTTSTAATITTGSSITIPSDFFRLRSVDKISGVNVGSDPVQLDAFSLQDRYSTRMAYRLMASTIDVAPITDAPGVYIVYYVPLATELNADITALPIAYAQYLDFIEVAASIPVRVKAEESASGEMKLKADMIAAIVEAAANRNSGPPYIPPAQSSPSILSRDWWPR